MMYITIPVGTKELLFDKDFTDVQNCMKYTSTKQQWCTAEALVPTEKLLEHFSVDAIALFYFIQTPFNVISVAKADVQIVNK